MLAPSAAQGPSDHVRYFLSGAATAGSSLKGTLDTSPSPATTAASTTGLLMTQVVAVVKVAVVDLCVADVLRSDPPSASFLVTLVYFSLTSSVSFLKRDQSASLLLVNV